MAIEWHFSAYDEYDLTAVKPEKEDRLRKQNYIYVNQTRRLTWASAGQREL